MRGGGSRDSRLAEGHKVEEEHEPRHQDQGFEFVNDAPHLRLVRQTGQICRTLSGICRGETGASCVSRPSVVRGRRCTSADQGFSKRGANSLSLLRMISPGSPLTSLSGTMVGLGG